MNTVPEAGYLVPPTWYHVLGTKYLVPSTWYKVLGTKYLVPNTWYQVPGTKYLVPSTWYQALGTKYVVPSRWYQIPRFVNSVHEPFTNRSRTSVHEQAFTNNSNTFTIAVHEQGAHSRSRTVHEQPFTNKPFTNIRTPFKLPLGLGLVGTGISLACTGFTLVAHWCCIGLRWIALAQASFKMGVEGLCKEAS